MGVHGLWKLLESAGKPIPVEKLDNKVLSIDVSIWLYQIIKGVKESEHGATTNKHLIVMFHRICKLLFYGIKPIFVFDGGVPELKRITIAQRQAQKARAKKSSGRTKEKILKNMLEQAALKTVMNAGNTPTEDEVISKTVSSLNKSDEIDLFELPKLPEVFEEDKILTKEKELYSITSKEKRENVVLLAVKNQENDFLYTNSAKCKEKASPAKLNTFSCLQIGELLNGYSDDQKRLSERKNQQKSKREMTFNELEMFLNDDNETNGKVHEFSQKIDSDQDTVFYYESNFNKASESSTTNNEITKKSEISKTLNFDENIETESKKDNKKIISTDSIGSPTLTEDIDEDIFKALAGDESLEEDRLAWLIFNENKKASKRRSSEFEAPNLKCLKTDSNTSEVATSDVEEDNTTTNNKTPSKIHSSKSIYITKDDLSTENCFDNYNEEDYLSWVSHSEDEPSEIEFKKEEPCTDHLSGPSTSKSLMFEHEGASISNSEVDQQCINSSMYFASTPDKPTEHNMSYNASPSIESDHSNYSFSETSVDFSPEENVSDDISDETNILLEKEKCKQSAEVQGYKKGLNSQEFKEITPTNNIITKKLKSPTKYNKKAIERLEPHENQKSLVDEQYLLSIQDTLVKHQNDLASLQKTSDRMASSITEKITSDIKHLLKLFGIPYITAPMEAEAQCAFLEKNGCTDGTVTDDSDIWLFGANVVYKDFFDSQKYVKQFKSIDLKQKFALSRNSLIQLAFFVGSDYTNGIDGIGPVSAIEIMSFFESNTKNMSIEEKLLKIKEIVNSKSEVYSDLPFMRKFKSTKIGNNFPNKAVINAYLNPIVNESNEKFNWSAPQLDSIIQYAQTNFDWDVSKTKRTLGPVLKKVAERKTQKTLDSFVKTLPKLSNTDSGMSKRVSLAVKRLRNDGGSIESTNQKSNSLKKKPSIDTNDGTRKKCRKTKK